MKKAYVLLYSDSVGGGEAIKAWMRSEKRVLHWRRDMPHAFYLVAESSAAELARSLGGFLRRKGRFLIMEASENRQGWLPAETWRLLRSPTNASKSKLTGEPTSADEKRH